MLEEKAVELIEKFELFAKQYTPEAIEMVKTVTQVSGISEIIDGSIFSLTGVVLAFATDKLVRYFYNLEKKDNNDYFYTISSFVIGCPLTSIAILTGVSHLLDIWNWVAIFKPELAIAHKLLGL